MKMRYQGDTEGINVRARAMKTRLFTELIMPFPIERCMHVTSRSLSDMKHDAIRNNQLMLFYSQLMRFRENIEPRIVVDDFLDGMKAICYVNVLHSVKREFIENKTIDLLSAEGIPSILLRGNAIARDIYQDPYCRTSSDTDLLIRQGDLKHVDTILSRNGYVRYDRLPLEFLVTRLHHAVYYFPKTLDLIEVHWNFGIPSFFRLTSEDIWGATVQPAKNLYELSPEMMLIHLLMHHYMHAFRDLKTLTDIIWALHRYDDSLDLSTLGLMMKRIGLLKIAAVTMNQIGTLCGKQVESEPALSKFRDVIEGTGCSAQSLLMSYFRLNLQEECVFQNKKDRFMSRLALDKSRTILRSFMTSLFPLPGDLKELYRDRRSWLLPLYYSRFIRWRMKEWMRMVQPADH
jgi:hypothetical protein